MGLRAINSNINLQGRRSTMPTKKKAPKKAAKKK
jgi:hypothetical protein